MTIPFSLALRHIRVHWFRNLLTVGAVGLATFLFCFLVSMIVSLESQVEASSRSRLVVQSSVSLFVDLPLDYEPKIRAVPGVQNLTKWQWFGAYYQRPEQQFTQFAIDPEPFFPLYSTDVAYIAGPERDHGDESGADELGSRFVPPPEREGRGEGILAAMLAEKRAALIGRGLAEKFGWRVGDTIPLTCTIFPKPDGSAWEFTVVGIYEKRKQNIDENTLFFRFDYLEDTVEAGESTGPLGTGTFFLEVAPGVEPTAVIGQIDALFANGPQRTKTSTEAAFQQGFVSMLGNLPLFLGAIGGAVLVAVFFSVVNSLLISGRQRLREAGILKALGFRDGAVAALIGFEAVLLTGLGGIGGAALAYLASSGIATSFPMFSNLAVEPRTMLIALGIALGIGLVGGISPMALLVRIRPTDALRSFG